MALLGKQVRKIQKQVIGSWLSAMLLFAFVAAPVGAQQVCREQLGTRGEPEQSLEKELSHHPYHRWKAVFDKGLVLATLPVTLPAIAGLAVLVKVANPSLPIFYQQERLSRGEQRFWIQKLRTMYPNDGTQGSFRGDPRVTWVGKYLRKFHLDELPQIFNIWRGEMSWVGPRPIPLGQDAIYRRTLSDYQARYLVPAGLTGLSRVRCQYTDEEGEARELLSHDLEYISKYGVLQDLGILCETIWVLPQGRAR